MVSNWAQFTLEMPNPTAFAATLRDAGIPTERYYPELIHMQTAYARYPLGAGGLTQTMDCIDHVISLPMHAYLSETDQDRIIETAKAALS